MWTINAPQFRARVLELQSGTTRRRISRKNLGTIKLRVPPLNEQRRIVVAIEEHLSRLDAADAALAAARRRCGAQRNAVLVTALPSPLPASWRVRTIGEVGEVDLGRQRSPRYHAGPNMRPYLRVANVFEARLDLSDVMDMDFSPADFAKYKLEPGDILLNEGQSPHLVGRPAMFRGELDDVCFTNSLLRFRPGPGLDGEFALLVFRHHLHAGRFKKEARITTNIAHLSAGRFKNVEFPLPPLEDQRRIVAGVEQRLSAIDALQTAVVRAQLRSTSLRRAILERAFRGELVPQDSKDEPALALLERIRTGRAAAPKETRRRSVSA
jgi:type I restriction enzyme S subunit